MAMSKKVVKIVILLNLIGIIVSYSLNGKLSKNWKMSKKIGPMFNENDTGFRLKLQYSGVLVTKSKSYNQADQKKNCSMLIFDELSEYLQFDIEDWKTAKGVLRTSTDSIVNIEAPSYHAKKHYYHIETDLNFDAENSTLNFEIELPISQRYRYPESNDISEVKFENTPKFYLSCLTNVLVNETHIEQKSLDYRNNADKIFVQNVLNQSHQSKSITILDEKIENTETILRLSTGKFDDLSQQKYYMVFLVICGWIGMMYIIFKSWFGIRYISQIEQKNK